MTGDMADYYGKDSEDLLEEDEQVLEQEHERVDRRRRGTGKNNDKDNDPCLACGHRRFDHNGERGQCNKLRRGRNCGCVLFMERTVKIS